MIEMTRYGSCAWQPSCCLACHQFSQDQRVLKVDWKIRYSLLVLCIQEMHFVRGVSLYEVSIHLDSVPTEKTRFDYKNDENGQIFSWKASTGGNLMLVWSLLGKYEHKNLQINCISQLLNVLSILSTILSTLKCP